MDSKFEKQHTDKHREHMHKAAAVVVKVLIEEAKK